MDLEKELSDPQLTRDKLLMLYAAAVQEQLPAAVIKQREPYGLIVERLGKEPTTVFLENLWRMLHQTQESTERVTVFENHVRSLGLSSSSEAETYTARNVIPIVKDTEYINFGNTDKQVHEHLVGDLWVLYAIDLPTRTLSLKAEEMPKLGLSRAGLRDFALANLREILPEVEVYANGAWYFVSAGGDYSASLLLLDEVWAQLEPTVDGEIVAVVPARDVILFTGSNSAEGIHAIKQKAHELCEGGHHVVSETLLRRTSGKWVVFD